MIPVLSPTFRRAAVATGLASLLLAASAAPGEAIAQAASRFSAAEVRVIAAQDFVNEAPGTQFAFGGDILLTLKDAHALAFASRGFQVRIFPLNAQGEPQAWAYFAPCRVYFSTVISGFRPSPGVYRVNVITLDDPRWLRVTRGRPPAPGRYMLVFEDRSDSEWFFRLNDADRARYFALGLRIEVTPRGTLSQALIDSAADDQAASAPGLRAEALDNSATHHCYRALPPMAGLDDAMPQVASLQRCDAD